jgi:hypothetical protein
MQLGITVDVDPEMVDLRREYQQHVGDLIP